jgi:molecular chaperone DnaJ
MRLRLAGEGDGGVRGRGDLYVHMTVKPHPIFRREGPHLIAEVPVNIAQAALGTDVDVPTLNGRVAMKVPQGTQSGTVFRVRGKGVPDVHSGRPGDLLVRVIVETPTNLNAAQRKLLTEFVSAFGDEVHPSHRSFLAKLKEALKK